jgi:SAM-dependent methyltransferase
MPSNDSGLYNKEVVKGFYYGSGDKLRTRIETWKNFGTNKTSLDDWLIAYIKILRPSFGKYLDAGCGTGQLLSKAYHCGLAGEIFGIDLSEKLVLEAKRSNPILAKNIIVSDIEQMDFADKSFDLITAVHVFHHIHDTDKALNELKRTCAKNGIIILTAGHYELDKGLNRLHYEALSDLDFPEFMISTSDYLRFSHTEAQEVLKKHFSRFVALTYANSLSFTRAEPVMAYYESAMMFRNSNGPDDRRITPSQWAALKQTVRARVDAEINTHGYFSSPGDVNIYICKLDD